MSKKRASIKQMGNYVLLKYTDAWEDSHEMLIWEGESGYLWWVEPGKPSEDDKQLTWSNGNACRLEVKGSLIEYVRYWYRVDMREKRREVLRDIHGG